MRITVFCVFNKYPNFKNGYEDGLKLVIKQKVKILQYPVLTLSWLVMQHDELINVNHVVLRGALVEVS